MNGHFHFRISPPLSSGEIRIALDAAMRSGTCRCVSCEDCWARGYTCVCPESQPEQGAQIRVPEQGGVRPTTTMDSRVLQGLN
jgi:hypothetical protein